MADVLISGITGLVGKRLTRALTRDGHSVTALAREESKVRSQFQGSVPTIVWDFQTPIKNLPEFEYVVHLAGEPLFGKRWSKTQKELIRSSRIDSTKQLVAALGRQKNKPLGFLCASAVGYYGDRGDETLDETSGPCPDFLSDICVAWENAANLAEDYGIRVVNLRTSVVLAKEGGALSQLVAPFKLGMGGPVGNGKQWNSWIHLEDEIGIILFTLTHDAIRGPVNLSSPGPVRNKEFAETLGTVLGRPSKITTPTFALKLVLGEAALVVTSSAKVIPEVALKNNYAFKFPTLDGALSSLLMNS